MEGYLTWTIWACPECGRDRGPVAQYIYRRCQCGSHRPQREVEVVPADDLRGAVELLEQVRDLLAQAYSDEEDPDARLRGARMTPSSPSDPGGTPNV